jgi:hypothetical protein
LTEAILALVCTSALWIASVRAYLAGRRRDWAFFAVGTLAAVIAISLAAWDLVVADVGRRGGLAIASSIVVVIVWSSGLGSRVLKLGS